jgi:hypothetical protein
VYAAAQHHWLAQHYPGQAWTRHYQANPFIGAAESERSESCFVIPQPGKNDTHVCFSNTEWCDESQKPGGTGPPNNRIQATAGRAAVLKARIGRSPAAPDAER